MNPLLQALPLQAYLEELHERLAGVGEGDVANYIPELSRADPQWFGIALVTVDGHVYQVGDSHQQFTIQSISKAITYGLAMEDRGVDAVLAKVGVEPSGEAFNSISLEKDTGRPFNPMINAGAIATTGLIEGKSPADKLARILQRFEKFVGHPVTVDEEVYRSERDTGHRNRAIVHLLRNANIVEEMPEEVVDLYFRQCSIRVTARDLALMGACLANNGVNPITSVVAQNSQYVDKMLSVMTTCGMYDYSGNWVYSVGMPSKRGVGGGIMAVLPGQFGLGVFSPPLDRKGNSLRGIRVCQEISKEFELHAFNNRTNVRSVIRRDYLADLVRSNRLRTLAERKILAEKGRKVAVLEAQGALFFGSTEQLMRRLAQLASDARYVIVDFKRVHLADSSARKLIVRAARAMAGGETELVFASMHDDGPLAPLARAFAEPENEKLVRIFRDADAALEWCEDQLLAYGAHGAAGAKFALSEINLFKGLKPEECRLLESIVQPLVFEKGDVIIREGADANLFFVLARGTVSVQIRVPGQGERKKRVASIGPGLSFGEMALLDGGKRSADIVADDKVICYGLRVQQLHELTAAHPNIMITILGNLTREFSERLRHANEEIGVLE